MSRPRAEPAGLSCNKQVGSSALTSSYYQHTSWSERGRKKPPPGMSVRPLSKTKIWASTRLTTPTIHHPPRSVLYCHHFIPHLLPPIRGEGIKKRGLYLTLICPAVSFREMTCNLRGKGQSFFLFFFLPSSPRAHFRTSFFSRPSKTLQTISASAFVLESYHSYYCPSLSSSCFSLAITVR